MSIWGIDLGGTKIEGVVLQNADSTNTLARIRIGTEADSGYEHIVKRVSLLVKQMKDETGLSPASIGIGTPGTLDPASGLLKNSNTTVLNGKPFKKDLETELGIPVVLANDANCLALAETHLGAVKTHSPGAKVVFGVIMGSGVGGGIVINGEAIMGCHGITGEWGHNFLDESGGPCYCGKTGCVERILSGKSLERFHKEQFAEDLKLKDIYTKYLDGSSANARVTIERLLEYFGKGIASVINILDPDVIVLGGGVGNVDHLYTEGVKRIEKYIFNPQVQTKILKPELGDSAGVFGAAFLTQE